ncbi:hypothetical protein CRYPA_884 [uncultured Candidatus Thioglobus sp.]|uniref:hypothetical protein n=1 Tax=Bathymodiolus heckerae thiotrophic gill symbiont TaxID=1052212 RepID=UPI0010BBE69E|nr:hypothetical protein [Bathymodiolus heckerae thiotrophic gill symbiont]CAC9543309.1 hypothetical protein [uncultured Gammaproteobacteria bacterium]SMN17087.1 hypothetical protein CRYPA_884 [uncultured Candidatus Thioglobus sp.]CAC9594255.1 hypothetical protein [uncultured Gammaproteobacteria bacterium]CAC9596150.1 hypothetical protein [uncultured Gammaproteobacteria bacterium]CAC9598083.1 hypothetical protein [uncultured Gammaproteobacteria bacterium]
MVQAHFTCPFSHLILSGRCGCQFGAKDCVAEKEFGACQDHETSSLCQTIYQNLRENSNFVLKTHNTNNLSVGQQSKIKMGGLLALQEVMGVDNGDKIDDIANLANKIKLTYPDLSDMPFSDLMPRIAKFKFRRKS